MYKIGEFSKITFVTVRTLHHYEQVGLLSPAHTDPFTGYRYYSAEQFGTVSRIKAFKEMGFSLEEIKRLLEGGVTEADLSAKLQDLRGRGREIERSISALEHYQKLLRGEYIMEKVIVKSIPAVLSISYRTVIGEYAQLNHICPEVVGPEMERMGLTCAQPEYCFNRYHDGEYRERDIDVEICEAIEARGADSELLNYVEFPEVPEAACIRCHGAYTDLGPAYAEVMQWVEENGYEPSEPPRWWFIDGIWNRERPEEWLTEIQVPVKKK